MSCQKFSLKVGTSGAAEQATETIIRNCGDSWDWRGPKHDSLSGLEQAMFCRLGGTVSLAFDDYKSMTFRRAPTFYNIIYNIHVDNTSV